MLFLQEEVNAGNRKASSVKKGVSGRLQVTGTDWRIRENSGTFMISKVKG
jgi:hypothetical protein